MRDRHIDRKRVNLRNIKAGRLRKHLKQWKGNLVNVITIKRVIAVL